MPSGTAAFLWLSFESSRLTWSAVMFSPVGGEAGSVIGVSMGVGDKGDRGGRRGSEWDGLQGSIRGTREDVCVPRSQLSETAVE